jgi:hypothetical protein
LVLLTSADRAEAFSQRTWAATDGFVRKPPSYVFVMVFAELIATPQNLDQSLDTAGNYTTLDKRGLRRDDQTGTHSIAVVVVGMRSTRRRLGVVARRQEDWSDHLSVVANSDNRRVTYPHGMVVGIVYPPHLKRLVGRYVEAAVWEKT